ncbi:MAG: membrane protein insertase YidC [Gemmatimonadetes bacterium]|nr:membrane protein insertase YidC [Gemmatimonadota bacterium]
MDRRTLLAITLILMVLVLPSVIMGPPPPRPIAEGPAVPPEAASPADTPDTVVRSAQPVLPRPGLAPVDTASVPPPSPEPVVVSSPLYRYEFSPRGARLVGAVLNEYESFAAGPPEAQLIPDFSGFLTYRLVFGQDTVSLVDWEFEPSSRAIDVGAGGAELIWVARRGAATVRLVYSFDPERYLIRIRGELEGIQATAGLLVVGLGPRLRSIDFDSIVDFRSYGVVTKARSTDNLKFSKLDSGERRTLDGPFEWVAIKSKYFLAAILAVEDGQARFGGAVATGGPRTQAQTKGFLGVIGRRQVVQATQANVLASLPMPAGAFSFALYIGPQEYRRLARIGHELQDVNPYGWILRPVIGPLSILVVRMLLWMHETLNLAYGWVLILFGIAIRLALWPLNQKAMRSTMAMQALQPEMKDIQERYKHDKQQQQKEMMGLYRKHGANPLGGCLPMVLQMPILFTLFFVFLNTIVLRGVPFLWLPDLSLADPLYIIPVIMGLSMFAVMKIGQIGVPPNPQTKMMVYFMPIMLTFLFLGFSAGLNLYYATSNIASIPQQWGVAQERMRRKKAQK